MDIRTINLDELAASLANGQHSIFGPSSSAMWLECPGSLIPNVLAEDEGNEDSAYGTVAHAVTEAWLTLGRKPVHMLGKKHFVPAGDWGYQIVADDEMFGYAKECVDRCVLLPGKHYIEQRVHFSDLTPIPYQSGTLDFAAWDVKTSTLYVIDHKFGSSPNNIVYAERNSQLMLYAWGMCKKLGDTWPDRFVFRINQPRLDHFDEWECSFNELAKFASYVEQQAALAWSLDAPRNPGIKQCKWCAVKATCAANAKMQEDLVSAVFGDTTAEAVQDFKQRLDDPEYQMHIVSPAELSTDQMARLLPYRSAVESFWKELAAELEKRALNGTKIPNHKLVEARTKRRWQNKSAAEKVLQQAGVPRSEYVQEKIVSPAQAEKLLVSHGVTKADLPTVLADAVIKPAGKPCLAPANDKRKEWVDPSESVFTDTTTSETEEL